MSGVVELGPLVMASERLLALALIIGFVIVLDRISARRGIETKRTTGFALIVGLVAARAAFVLSHLTAFSGDWLSALAFWQGGFVAWAGIAATAAVLVLRLRPRDALIRGLATLALLAVVWFAGSSWIRPAPAPLPQLPILTTLDGSRFASTSLDGRPFVINLWATWCPPCRRELPMLAKAAAQGVPILLVNQGEDASLVRSYLTQNNVKPNAVLLDPESVLSQKLGSAGLPVTLFVDRSGNIVDSHLGEISRAALLAGAANIGAEAR